MDNKNTDLSVYIRGQLSLGVTREKITETLLGSGWTAEQVEPAFRELDVMQNQDEPPISSPVTPLSPRVLDGKKVGIIVGCLLLLSAVGAAGYFAVTGSFVRTPALTNEDILETLTAKLGEINTASYALNFSLSVNPIEEGAKSFQAKNPIDANTLAQYQRDQDRIRDISTLQEKSQDYRLDDKSFPKTLQEILGKSVDPQGKPYGYTAVDKGVSYEFSVSFETAEAYTAVSQSLSAEVLNEESKTVTIGPDDYIFVYDFTGEPAQPKLFGLFGLSEIEEMVPSNFAASFTLGGTMDRSAEAANGKLRVSGALTMDDAEFAFDAEGMKKGSMYYGIINKIPSLFAPLSQIRGKWVGFSEDDLRNYGYMGYVDEFVPNEENERKEELGQYAEQSKKIMQIADRNKLVAITTGPVKDTVDNQSLLKYTLVVNKEKLLQFYEEVTGALKEYGDDALIKRDETTLEYLKGSEFSPVFDHLKDNVTLTLWMNKEGYPARMELGVRYVPSDKARALKGKQLNLVTTLRFDEINKPIVIDVPETVTNFEDFVAEVTGLTKEEVILNLQESNVDAVRSALGQYYDWTGQYPMNLAELTKKREDVAQKPADSDPEQESYSSYFDYYQDEPFLKAIPNDAFTRAPFSYESTGSDYKLGYMIKLVPYQKDKNPANYYPYPGYEDPDMPTVVYTPKYLEGTNIATKDHLSEAQLQVADADKDVLSDSLEKIFGTDPKNADSDNDGFTDFEEITTGSNPTGPGRLDY